ncbi:MAG: glycoside hydrolase family 104 protein [Candidatus Babeliaceae bacterium]|jgi:muramidase (phage lysozyme)
MKNIAYIYIIIQVCALHAQPEQWTHQDYLKYRSNPQVKAFLDTIAYAEGTLNEHGYNARYPGLSFASFKDHPRIVSCAPYKGKDLCATAAGRYMILARTWDRIAPIIKATHFSPLNQDKAALELIREAHALQDIIRGNFNRAVQKLNKIWATFPGAPYGQPTKALSDLKKIYYNRLKQYLP